MSVLLVNASPTAPMNPPRPPRLFVFSLYVFSLVFRLVRIDGIGPQTEPSFTLFLFIYFHSFIDPQTAKGTDGVWGGAVGAINLVICFSINPPDDHRRHLLFTC